MFHDLKLSIIAQMNALLHLATRSTRPRFAATSFEDFAISYEHHLSSQLPPVPILILSKNIRSAVPSNACPLLRIERSWRGQRTAILAGTNVGLGSQQFRLV